MAEKEHVETSEAQIAVHWQEEEYFYPSTEFVAQANMTDKGVFERFSLDNFPECFKEYADLLTWNRLYFAAEQYKGSRAALTDMTQAIASGRRAASAARSASSRRAAVAMTF